jgi:hypothetical protein
MAKRELFVMKRDVQRPKKTTLGAMGACGVDKQSVKTMALSAMVKLFVMNNAMRIITYNKERIRYDTKRN